MGDGVLVYFGWPKGHEDDAERAVRAEFAIIDAVANLTTSANAPLEARVGIATGIVIVGDRVGEGPAQEQAVVGETPNLAARLQALADAGNVVIAESTHKLLGGLFELADLGTRDLKGFSAPIRAFRVVGERPSEGRFEALHGHQFTPLVGRDHEVGLLLERFERARDGEGQVVLLPASPALASRVSPWRSASGWIPNRSGSCAIKARPIMGIARCGRLSASWNGQRRSRQTIRPRRSSKRSSGCWVWPSPMSQSWRRRLLSCCRSVPTRATPHWI